MIENGMIVSNSIIQPWVAKLGLRHQGVLMSFVRGCDGLERENASKTLNRFYRACVLRSHVGDPKKAVSFMIWFDHSNEFWDVAYKVLNSFDQYPNHFVMHMLHAAEICGYKMPSETIVKQWWAEFYRRFVKKMHLNVETEAELDARLGATEEEFKRLQHE